MHTISRRTLVALLVATAWHSAHAQSLSPAAPIRNEVLADDGHKLVLWSKTPAQPKGEIVLLHGRTWSALPNFDLQVPGAEVSTMDALAAKGYAVYALDQRGYGSTSRDKTGWLTPNRAERDAANVTDWVAARAPSNRRPALMGYSRGSATAMLAAQRHPGKISGLMLYAFYYDITNPPEPVEEPDSPPRAKTTREAAAEDFLTPPSTPRGVKAAYVREAVRTSPVRVDWRREDEFGELDPSKIRVPTLLINGDRDPIAQAAELPVFYAQLGTVDKWWIVLSGADHVAHLERTGAFVQALTSFLERVRK